MNLFRITVESQQELDEILSKVSPHFFIDADVEQWIPDGDGDYGNLNSKFTREDLVNKRFPQAHPETTYIQVGNILWQISG